MIYIIKIALNHAAETPIYQQIVDSVSREIHTGALPPGYRLPTVREFSAEYGVSQGTIKHAYDALERLGLIDKTQGRGTFVSDRSEGRPAGKKERTLAAIDHMLDEVQGIGMPLRDVRIYLELKLREREQLFRSVRVGAVDCSPEALAAMCRQISTIAHVDVYEYLLGPVLDAPGRFDPGHDIVVTTPTHADDLHRKMPPDREPAKLVMAISTETAMALARIPPGAKVGALCASERFCRVILNTCGRYCELEREPATACFGDAEVTKRFLDEADWLILPPGYLGFCSEREQVLVREHAQRGRQIVFEYQVERGSLLYLEDQVEKIYRNNQNHI